MQTTVVYQIAFLISFIGLSVGKKVTELIVKTKYKPADCSQVAEAGDEVGVHYTGYLDTGTIFDSSVKAGRDPLVFNLGEGRVIPGWEQGIKGMCVGEKRKLTIPHHLAYGQAGFPPSIPPEATLTFETELMTLQKKTVKFNVQGMLQFLLFPLGGTLAVYYMYQRYHKEASVARELKKNKKRK